MRYIVVHKYYHLQATRAITKEEAEEIMNLLNEQWGDVWELLEVTDE